ncbi:unnamed protein product [Psylliodes chrysocephalus]|uniref:G-protein coupled receptors family 1 profile domain-containing protein n=1 Tax=Psylliodes chrysocephalus TaxID=3402493 RepID=A0A9P0GBI4_9CUCU|nr:unnamed protein product [Psylliodes chrysocephala]
MTEGNRCIEQRTVAERGKKRKEIVFCENRDRMTEVLDVIDNVTNTTRKTLNYGGEEEMLMTVGGYVGAAVVLFLIGFFGFFLNLGVIILMWKDKQLKLVYSVTGISSITTLTVLAFERYLIVSRPFRNHGLSRKEAMLFVIGIWLYSLALTVPPLIGWGKFVAEAANISSSLPEYSHIRSLRRQVYVSPHNFSLPDSFTLDFDDTTYRIFLSQDGMVCYNCKKPGHIVSQFPESTNASPSTQTNTIPQTTTPTVPSVSSMPIVSANIKIPFHTITPQTNILPLSIQSTTVSANIQQSATAENSTQEAITQPLPKEQSPPLKDSGHSKRSINEILLPDTDVIDKENSIFTLPKIKPKSKKQSPTLHLQQLPRVIPIYIDWSQPKTLSLTTPFILNYDQLQLLLTNVTSSSDPIKNIL